MSVFVIGDARLVGSNVVLGWLAQSSEVKVNLNGSKSMGEHWPCVVASFAGESHGDCRIIEQEEFIQVDVFGAFRLLRTVSADWARSNSVRQRPFRLLPISADKAYGSPIKDESGFGKIRLARLVGDWEKGLD